MTIDQGLRQTRISAPQADAVVFVETAFGGTRRTDRDARYALQGIRNVLIRHLADILCRNDINMGFRIALHFQRFFQRAANTGNNHGVN